MSEKLKSAATGFALLLATTAISQAEEAKFDKSVAMAAAEKAANRMGEIRGSIDHTAKPEIVTPNSLKDEPPKETSLLPRPAWQPLADKDVLPPMVNLDDPMIDTTMTGSISRSGKLPVNAPKRMVWERFDNRGRLIKP